MLLAFAVGKAARFILLEGPRDALLAECRLPALRDRPDHVDKYAGNNLILPPLVARDGKKLPQTRYTAKNFNTARSSVHSTWLAKNREIGSDAETCSDAGSATKDDDDDSEVDLQPAGEHLMVDIKNVNGVFLNSEHLLSRAMIDVVDEAELTLLSYHCHGLSPAGVSCVGILLHNYISFHTWPVEGVITFDLCSAGSKSILPVLPVIERLFGVPRTTSHPGQVVESPEYRWAHKLRGFRHHPTTSSHLFLGTDLGAIVLRVLGTEYKEEVRQQTVLNAFVVV
jgi:S-adenosylmethionine/arginine decarboxylase-like enzyme